MTTPALVHGACRILAAALVDLGVATAPSLWASGSGSAWPAFYDGEPDRPDNVITVYDTEGQDDGRDQTGDLNQHYGVQVRVRSVDAKTGRTKMAAVRTALAVSLYDAVVTLDGSSYTLNCATGIKQVIPLGKEVPSAKRSLFTLNLMVVITPRY